MLEAGFATRQLAVHREPTVREFPAVVDTGSPIVENRSSGVDLSTEVLEKQGRRDGEIEDGFTEEVKPGLGFVDVKASARPARSPGAQAGALSGERQVAGAGGIL